MTTTENAYLITASSAQTYYPSFEYEGDLKGAKRAAREYANEVGYIGEKIKTTVKREMEDADGYLCWVDVEEFGDYA